MLNLIVNEASDGKNDKEGYITLEFRQNAYGDEPLIPGQGLVSFKLDKIADRIPGKAGLNIRVKVYTTANIIKPLTLKQTRTKLFFAIPFSMSFYKSGAGCLPSLRFVLSCLLPHITVSYVMSHFYCVSLHPILPNNFL